MTTHTPNIIIQHSNYAPQELHALPPPHAHLVNEQQNNLIRYYNLTDAKCNIYAKASRYYSILHYILLGINVIILGVASCLSFIASSAAINEDLKFIFLISIGVLTVCAGICVTLDSKLQFKTRMEMFERSSNSYDNLHTKLMKYFSIPLPSDFETVMEEKLISIKNKTKFLPPIFIEKRVMRKMDIIV